MLKERRMVTERTLSDSEWKAFDHKVKKELRSGKGRRYASAQALLNDLRRRMRDK